MGSFLNRNINFSRDLFLSLDFLDHSWENWFVVTLSPIPRNFNRLWSPEILKNGDENRPRIRKYRSAPKIISGTSPSLQDTSYSPHRGSDASLFLPYSLFTANL